MRRKKADDLDTLWAKRIEWEPISTEHLQCRDFGHSWAPYTAKVLGGRMGGYEYTLRCTRCQTLRHRVISRTGAVMTSSYAYPDGYLVKGMGRLTGADREQLRLASILRVLDVHQGA